MIVSLLLFTPSTPTAACDFHSPTRRKARLSLLQASFLNAKLGIKTQLAGQARPCDATPTGHSQRVDAVVRACKAKEILCLGIKSCTLHASLQQQALPWFLIGESKGPDRLFLQTTLRQFVLIICMHYLITSANKNITRLLTMSLIALLIGEAVDCLSTSDCPNGG